MTRLGPRFRAPAHPDFECMKPTPQPAGFTAHALPRVALRRLVVTAAAILFAFAGADALAKTGLDAPILVTQVPAKVDQPPRDWDPSSLVRSDAFDGARLVVVTPDGKTRLLSQGFHSACDPNVSFDGQRVLFAGRRTPDERWRIWEIGVDGTELRPISPESLDARSPLYVSVLNTLESPQPWYTVVFVARDHTPSETGRASVSHLYNVKFDGTELRRLTFNPNANLDPIQMWDGRVIYAAERHPNEPGARAGHVGLYAIHIEGADMEFYGGAKGARIQQMPCATDNGLVVFVEAAESTWDGAGQLGCVEQRRPHVTYRALTHDKAYVFRSPALLQGNHLLVARRAANRRGTWGVVRFDADRGDTKPVFDSREYHEVQAVPLQPRHRPDGHSTVVTLAGEFGTFYGMNCYTADPLRQAHIRKGEVKKVRFIEGVVATGPSTPRAGASADPAVASATTRSARPNRAATDQRIEAHDLATVRGPLIARRLVGEAPVEPDGSFNVVVPADTPLLLQTVDERGLALGTCGWIWVKPKEIRGCIGCHEDPELTPENEYVQALRRPSNRLLLPPEQRRTVAFREHVAPILQRSCATAECHGGEDTPLHLPLLAGAPSEADLQRAYDALTTPAADATPGPAAWPRAGKYVDAGRARTSPLVWQLVGSDTSRPWDRAADRTDAPTREIKAMPAHANAAPLSEAELQTLIQWIDLGAQYEAAKTQVEEAR